MRTLLILLLPLAVACGEDPPPPADSPCTSDEECTMAIDATACCGCPVAALLSEVEDHESYVSYEPGTDFHELREADCEGDVDCSDCYGPPIGAECSESGSCALAYEPEDTGGA